MEDFIPAIEYWLERRCVRKIGRVLTRDLYSDYDAFVPQIPQNLIYIKMSKIMFSRALKSMLPYKRIGGFSYFYNISIAY